MNLVTIESPYAGDIERNVDYARKCLLHSLNKGEAPIASHLLYTQVLVDADPAQRKHGMEAGFAWRKHSDTVAFYVDYGMSAGMQLALERAREEDLFVIFRSLSNKCPCHFVEELWEYETPDSSGWDRTCLACKRHQHGTFPQIP